MDELDLRIVSALQADGTLTKGGASRGGWLDAFDEPAPGRAEANGQDALGRFAMQHFRGSAALLGTIRRKFPA